jgi:calcium-dependent protein kinase
MENFLYSRKGSKFLKLIDFGFSKGWDSNSQNNMGLTCGTLSYMAPEVLQKNYGSQCDMWSVGVVAFALLMGYMPFSGSDRWMHMCIGRGKYTVKQEQWEKISTPAQHFVTSLLQVDPDRRLSAQEALEHEWIAMRSRAEEEIDASVIDALKQFGQASRFRRCCMEMMAWSLSHEERLLVSPYFTLFDANKDGIITLEELQNVLEGKFNVPAHETMQIFKAMDSNNDEEIHYSDFLAAMVSSRIALHDDLLKASFKKFDTDSTGYITATNLREVFVGDVVATAHNSRITEVLSREVRVDGVKIKTLMKEAVSSGHHISYPEFERFLRAESGPCNSDGPPTPGGVCASGTSRVPNRPSALPSRSKRWLPCCTV